MFYVYILKSLKDSKLYIGFAPDLRQRIGKHSAGNVFSTKHRRPLELVYYEAYRNKGDALMRERQLKRFAKGYASLKRRIANSLLLEG
ncbi:GIY-YIG nuclease family protein [Candidatus Microgenomates bacterium]|nr:GIY-YIG nuclease family protein [Candidatus Microgenomates bacterium]